MNKNIRVHLITGLLLLFFSSSFSSCSRQVKANKSTSSSAKEHQAKTSHYLPNTWKNITLGQAQGTVLPLRQEAYVVNSLTATQWQQYTEDLDDDRYTSAYYNFEKSEKKRLVSVAILHKDESSAEASFKNFGGSLVNSSERERIDQENNKIYATKNGRRVTFMLSKAVSSRNQ